MIKNIFLSLFLLTCVFSVAQEWKPCNLAVNNNNTFGTDVCIHKGKIYAVNQTGLYVSEDNGASFKPVNDKVTAPQIDLYSTGDRLYTVMHNSGCSYIQYSTDDGASFTIDTAGLPLCYNKAVTTPSAGGKAWKNHLIFSLAGPDWEFTRNTDKPAWEDADYFDPNDCSEFFIKNDTCWAATNGATSNGVAWSADGINWTSPVSTGIPPYYVPSQIAWLGNKLFLMGMDVSAKNAGADTIIKYSNDYGLSFQEYNIKKYLSASPFFSNSGKQPTLDMYTGYGKLYLTLSNNVNGSAPDLIVSSDGGQTFVKDTLGFPTDVSGTVFSIRNMAFLNGWVFAQLNTGDLYRKQLTSNGISFASPKPSVQLFPNPVKDQLYFHTSGAYPLTYRILNIQGSEIANGTVETGKTMVDCSAYTPGMYILTVIESSGYATSQRFVKY